MDNYEVAKIQQAYLPGTRIQMGGSEGSESLIPPGEKGTVEIVDDVGLIFVNWDNGMNTALTPGQDDFKRLSIDDQILEAEAIRDEQIAAKHRKRNNRGFDRSEGQQKDVYEEER